MEMIFTEPDAWIGGFYELSVRSPDSPEEVKRKALYELWSLPDLQGCHWQRNVEPEAQEKISLLNIPLSG